MTYHVRRFVAGTLLAAFFLSGCAESTREEATGEGRIRGINAIVTAPELLFRIEERSIGNINYRGVAGFADWDDLSYNFNFDLLRSGSTTPDRLASQFIDVVADVEYTLVITGTLDNPSLISWEAPEPVFDAGGTAFEADFVNLSPLLGEVDVYYALEGTAPVLGNEVGTLASGERLPYMEFPTGDYELILTPPDDPATIVFQSSALAREVATRVTFALFDADPSITANVGVTVFSAAGGSQSLADANSPPQIRTLHAAFGTGNFDGYLNDDFGNVVFPDVGFRELSAYTGITGTVTPLTLTPVGNPGAVLLDTDIQLLSNSLRTIILYGPPGALVSRNLVHDARPVALFPVVRITNLSSNIEALDIYEVDPGTVIDATVIPSFRGAVVGVSTGFFNSEAGGREFVVTLNGEKDPIAAPLALDLANGDIVDIIIVDTADPAIVELSVFDSTL